MKDVEEKNKTTQLNSPPNITTPLYSGGMTRQLRRKFLIKKSPCGVFFVCVYLTKSEPVSKIADVPRTKDGS